MKTNVRLMLFVSFLLLVTGMGLLSACNGSGGESTSDLDSRITKLETDVQANEVEIATLQQQVQVVQQKVDALLPVSPIPVAPPAPVTPPVSTVPSNPTGLLASASVVLDTLTITPAEVNIGQTVTMSIQVSNKGTVDGSYRVVLTEKMAQASDVLEYANLVTLKPGETKTVTFTTTKNVAGTYAVQVGTKVGQYTVLAPPPPTSSE